MADTSNNGIAGETVVVILAAGKGSRMGQSDLGKVCFEIDSVPAINRIIGVFKKLRFRRFLVVVGSKAQQVLDTVAREHPDVGYVYQSPQSGTGHAAKVAAEVLGNLDYQGNVLVTMADKFIEPEALEALVDGFTRQQADLALLTIPHIKASEGSADWVVLDDDGQAVDIVDSADQVERPAAGVNPSLYLFRAEAFLRGVAMIDNQNAQGEYYMTDVVRHLSAVRQPDGKRRYKVRAVPVEHAEWIQGFNSPDELLAIQDYVRRRKLRTDKPGVESRRVRLKGNQYTTVDRWLAKLDAASAGMTRWMRRIYGDHPALHRRKAADLKRVLTCYGKRFGLDEKVCVVRRAPGRVNLMGRHVDHRGGMTNFLAIDRETIAVVGLRDDNDVVAVSTDPQQYRPVHFNVSELIGRFAWSDWLDFVNSDWVRGMLHSEPGHWGNYIKAAALRLQHRFQDVRIQGLNMAVTGDVPIAAGLSSSSTLVVATLQAAIALNDFELASRQFIDLCGEGEWFVGSRGGAGDHAAIYLGQRGKIAQVGYLPFRVERIIDAPRDFQVVIANSHVQALKSSRAKDTFNARVAGYNLGLALLKQRCPEIADSVEHVRDIDPVKIGCSTAEIYRKLLKVPESMTRKEFRGMLSGRHRELIDANFATHAEPEVYHPRGVLLYGAAEVVRSRMCVDYLEEGRVGEFGKLMEVSHDGDRVSRPDAEGDYRPLPETCPDEYLERLINDLAGEDPQKVLGAELYMQPGVYACSTVEIDRMVDIASKAPGVAGAQIAGAGLGGCIMVLARRENVGDVRKALTKHYYRPAGLKPAVLPCIAVEGAGLVEF